MSPSVGRPLSIIVPSLLAILLFSPSVTTVHAFAILSHDDGSRDAWYGATKGKQLFVGFSVPYPEEYRIVIVEFLVNEPGVFFKFHIYGGAAIATLTPLYESETWLEAGLDPGQWVQAHVTKEIMVEGALGGYNVLWVGVEYETDNKPGIGLDTTTYDTYKNLDMDRWLRLYSNSFEGIPGAVNPARVPGDLMIRVQVDTPTKREKVVQEAPGVGLGFAIIAIGAGAAAAVGGLAVAISQPRSEVNAYCGYYYCRRHQTPVWSVEGRLWCPIERRFLRL